MGCGSSKDNVTAIEAVVKPPLAKGSWRDSRMKGGAASMQTPAPKPRSEGTWRDVARKPPTFRAIARTIASVSSFVEPDAPFPTMPKLRQDSDETKAEEPVPKRKHVLVFSGTPTEMRTAEFVQGLDPLPPYFGAGRIDEGGNTIFRVYMEFPKPLVLAAADYTVQEITPTVHEGSLKALMAIRKLEDFYEAKGSTTATSRISKKGTEAGLNKMPTVRGLAEDRVQTGVHKLRSAFSISKATRILIAGARMDNVDRGNCLVCNMAVLQTQHRERQMDGTYRHAECIAHDLVEEYL